ncbi:hypothetical protein MAR_013102 [Mya arenaria]|uniref:Uncharacterized protein n=1 Tax=Mya arenaria TaxID=6604 RepID=A0ABY7G2N7_MYAAR|nr:hypothetical protein MAR_013102 [Mya arenaria]
MMSDRGYPGREDWHRRGSQEVGQRKIAELQRQIASMEIDMRERADLVHKLNRLQQIEEDKRIVEDKVLERNSRNNSRNSSRNGTPRLLKSEMERLYGRDSHLDGGGSPVDRQVLETVIKHRTKEFSQKQQETALKAKFLDKERQRLQEARRHVEEQRQALLAAQSPTGKPKLSFHKDKLYLPYEPYHAFENRENRVRDSFVLPISTEMPKISRWKFKLHYVPVPVEEYSMWKQYNEEVLTEHKEEVDEAVAAFQSFTDKRKSPVRYRPEFDPEPRVNYGYNQDPRYSNKRNMEYFSSGKNSLFGGKRFARRAAAVKSIQRKAKPVQGVDSYIKSTVTQLPGTIDKIFKMRDNLQHHYNYYKKPYNGELDLGSYQPWQIQDYFLETGDMIDEVIGEMYHMYRDDIWGHSQYAMNKVKKRKITRKAGGEEVVEEVEADEEEEEEDVDAPDLTILDFNTIPTVQPRSLEPSLLDPAELLHEKEAFRRYSRRELNYWKKMVPTVHEHTFDKKSRGLRLVQTSPNHRFIAATTFHGDIMVYDLSVEPWRPFRVLTYDDKKDNPVTDISWSLDGTRFTAINSLGRLQVISVVSGQVDFGPGPLAEEGVQDDDELAPQKAAFFPSLSFLGTQNDVMVSLDNGDILKCNIQDAVKSINPEHLAVDNDCPRIYRPLLSIQEEATDVNAIGRDVEAELLRAHKKSIVYMCFVESLGTMITVDQRGFIYKWKYNIKFKASFGWYIPSRKFKLETSKIMYKESEKDKPKVVFTDQTAPGKKPRTRQEIAAQRKRVQNTLENMQLGEPWHQEDLDEEDMLMQIFAPRGVIAETGAMFHIVYRDLETDKLSTYVTRLYKPVKVRCTQVMHVSGSPTSAMYAGRACVRLPHQNCYKCCVTANIPGAMYAGRACVGLPNQYCYKCCVTANIPGAMYRGRACVRLPHQCCYKCCVTSHIPGARYVGRAWVGLPHQYCYKCCLTRVMGSTGTEYLFIVFNGRVRAISLLTGQTVARTGLTKDENANDDEDEEEEEDDKPIEFPGCIVDENLLFYPPDAECKVACLDGRMHCILYGRKMSKMYIITFVDKNKYSERRAMYKTYTTLPKPRKVPVDLRLNTHQWQLDDIQHPAVAARRMILRKIDVEMRKAGLIRDHPKLIKRIAMSDKVENYKSLDKDKCLLHCNPLSCTAFFAAFAES